MAGKCDDGGDHGGSGYIIICADGEAGDMLRYEIFSIVIVPQDALDFPLLYDTQERCTIFSHSGKVYRNGLSYRRIPYFRKTAES